MLFDLLKEDVNNMSISYTVNQKPQNPKHLGNIVTEKTYMAAVWSAMVANCSLC